MLDDLADRLNALFRPADRRPELGAVVEVERGDGSGGLGRLHALDDDLGGGLRKRREDATRVEPLDPAAKNLRPIEVARLELRGGLVGAVVEDHRSADAVAAVGVNRGDVGNPRTPSCLKCL